MLLVLDAGVVGNDEQKRVDKGEGTACLFIRIPMSAWTLSSITWTFYSIITHQDASKSRGHRNSKSSSSAVTYGSIEVVVK